MAQGPSKTSTAGLRSQAPIQYTDASASGLIRTPALLASSLDALVRATRVQGPGLESIAKRITSLWRHHAGVRLVVEPTALKVEDEIALEANGQEGGWILPTFMSGLRQLSALPMMRTDDVLRLCEELAGLETTIEALTTFRDWLWSDGAEGFEIDLQPSFVEVIESVSSMGEKSSPSLASIRGVGLQALGQEQITMSAQELDMAAARPEFRLPLELYHQARGEGRLEISSQEQESLREACDDGAGWIDAETSVVLQHPELAAAVPPQRLARRIVGLSSGGVEPRLLEQLSGIHRRRDSYSEALIEALETQELDRALAQGLQLTQEENIPAVREFLGVASPKLASGVLQSMIRQADDEKAVFTGLVDLFATERFDQLVEAADVPTLEPNDQATLTRAILSTETATRQLPKILSQLPPRSAATVLAELPGEVVDRLQPLVERLLRSEEPKARETVAHNLLTRSTPRTRELLQRALVETRGRGWSKQTLKALVASLTTTSQGTQAAMELARSRQTSKALRLISLEALERHPQALAKAIRWRLTELWDPPEIKACLQRLRQRHASKGAR